MVASALSDKETSPRWSTLRVWGNLNVLELARITSAALEWKLVQKRFPQPQMCIVVLLPWGIYMYISILYTHSSFYLRGWNPSAHQMHSHMAEENRTHALKILKNVSENFPLPRSQWKYTFCCKTQVGLETRCNFRKGARREVEINVIIVSIFVEPSLLDLLLLIKFSFLNFTLEYWLIQSID